jgi:predicted phosphoribosyltransferase
MPFQNRQDAGQRLASALEGYKQEQPVVLALPRGGVPVAAEIAAALGAPLDLILVRKIGVPIQPELAMGAVVDGPAPIVVRNEDVISMCAIKEAEFKRACVKELREIRRRRKLYLTGREPIDIQGRVVIVVDDGIATGATTRAALRAARSRQPKKLVLAVGVGSTDTLEALRSEADDIVCLEPYETLGAIGFYYADFRQITDEEVLALLTRATREARAEPKQAVSPAETDA